MKLLVNTPSGEQQVLKLALNGSYFDVSRVLWDERLDGPLPQVTVGGMLRQGANLIFDEDRLAIHSNALKPSLREKAKDIRTAAVDAITVEVNGKVFDGNEISQERMARAILISQLTGITETEWTLANNNVVVVTAQELSQALIASGLQQAALWDISDTP